MLVIFCVITIVTLVNPSSSDKGPITDMTKTHIWNNLEYWFHTPEDYQYAIANGLYIPTGFKRPYDVDLYVDRSEDQDSVTLFITSPKIVRGIPYSLATVSNLPGDYGMKLLPYPNFSAHSPYDTPTCDRIISVFRIYVDPCNRLWVMDTGRDFFANSTQVCPPKILLYDLQTDELLFKYTVPEGQYIPFQSVHNGIIVDIYDPPPKGNCRKGKAYVTDPRGFSFLVFDLASMSSWVIFNEKFKPDPAYTSITIAGETFNFPDGLYTSTPYKRDNKIFLHSMTSLNELAAPLNLVNDKSLWLNNPSGNQEIFQIIGSRPTQSPTQTIDSHGNIYFSLLNPLEIVSWNPNKSYKLKHFETVVRNYDDLQFVASLKVRYNSKNEEMLLGLSNRLQKLNTGSISLAEENYKILVCKMSTIRRGKGKCGGL